MYANVLHHETLHITGHYETPSDNIEHGETHGGRVTGMSFIVGSLNLGHCVNLHVYKCYIVLTMYTLLAIRHAFTCTAETFIVVVIRPCS